MSDVLEERRVEFADGSTVRVNDDEWRIATAPKGSVLRVSDRGFRSVFGPVIPKIVRLEYSWFYDGVIGECKDFDGHRVSVHPALGDQVEVLWLAP